METDRTRRPNLDFIEMGIPKGATLVCVKTKEKATVRGDRKVRFRGEEMYLSKATRLTLNISRPVQPTPHWTYKGRLLRDIYRETYGG